MTHRRIWLQLRYFAELLNGDVNLTLLARRRPGLGVLNDFGRKTLQKKTTREERSESGPFRVLLSAD